MPHSAGTDCTRSSRIRLVLTSRSAAPLQRGNPSKTDEVIAIVRALHQLGKLAEKIPNQTDQQRLRALVPGKSANAPRRTARPSALRIRRHPQAADQQEKEFKLNQACACIVPRASVSSTSSREKMIKRKSLPESIAARKSIAARIAGMNMDNESVVVKPIVKECEKASDDDNSPLFSSEDESPEGSVVHASPLKQGLGNKHDGLGQSCLRTCSEPIAGQLAMGKLVDIPPNLGLEWATARTVSLTAMKLKCRKLGSKNVLESGASCAQEESSIGDSIAREFTASTPKQHLMESDDLTSCHNTTSDLTSSQRRHQAESRLRSLRSEVVASEGAAHLQERSCKRLRIDRSSIKHESNQSYRELGSSPQL